MTNLRELGEFEMAGEFGGWPVSREGREGAKSAKMFARTAQPRFQLGDRNEAKHLRRTQPLRAFAFFFFAVFA